MPSLKNRMALIEICLCLFLNARTVLSEAGCAGFEGDRLEELGLGFSGKAGAVLEGVGGFASSFTGDGGLFGTPDFDVFSGVPCLEGFEDLANRDSRNGVMGSSDDSESESETALLRYPSIASSMNSGSFIGYAER